MNTKPDITPTQMTLRTHSADQTVALGAALGTLLEPGDVIALTGELGAGKTQFVRGIATGLGADPRLVSSPTFVLMSEYPGRVPIVHIDAYRIHTLADLESAGFTDELLTGAVTAIEWSERLADELPADHLHIVFDHEPDGRSITFHPRGRFALTHPNLSKLRSINV